MKILERIGRILKKPAPSCGPAERSPSEAAGQREGSGSAMPPDAAQHEQHPAANNERGNCRSPIKGPQAYAIVAAISRPAITGPQDLRRKKRVRVLDGPAKGKIGVVTQEADSKGYVKVRYDSGGEGYFSTGNGRLGLEIIDGDGSVTIVRDGKIFETSLPEDFIVEPGDAVLTPANDMRIIGMAPNRPCGVFAYFIKKIDGTRAEVEYQSMTRVVFIGKTDKEPESGDRLILDQSGSVIIENLGQEKELFAFAGDTQISWEDIGGLEEAKAQMIEAIELPRTQPEIYAFYKKRPIKGILLLGPPGCGKTMLGKAIATSLARLAGDPKANGFFHMKGPEVLSKWVSVAEATIRQVFTQARKFKEKYGYPAVIFIDEADAILGRRGAGISSDVERTIVPQFLTEMDGIETSGAIVILATNRPDTLDPAIVRDGRIDLKIKIPRPTQKSAADILLLNLKDMPIAEGQTAEELAAIAAQEIFSARHRLSRVETKQGGPELSLSNIVNGGMLANIAQQAATIAMRRDLRNKTRSGISRDDVVAAIDAIKNQHHDLNHSDEILELIDENRHEFLKVHRLSQVK